MLELHLAQLLGFVLATIVALYLELVVKRSRHYMQLAAGISTALIIGIVSIFVPEVEVMTWLSGPGRAAIILYPICLALIVFLTTVVTVVLRSDTVPRAARVASASIIGGVPIAFGVSLATC